MRWHERARRATAARLALPCYTLSGAIDGAVALPPLEVDLDLDDSALRSRVSAFLSVEVGGRR
jgi:hypothetical protein